MTEIAMASAFLIAFALLIVLAMLVRKVFVGKNLPVTSGWIEELSFERYRPMLRLLDGGDIEFLKSQPGFTPQMATKLRAQRIQMFRGYLRSLESDFSQVCAALKLMMLQSKHDRPELAQILVRQQVQFAFGIWSTHFRLFFYQWGVCGVDGTSLVKSFEGLRLELRTMVPAAMSL